MGDSNPVHTVLADYIEGEFKNDQRIDDPNLTIETPNADSHSSEQDLENELSGIQSEESGLSRSDFEVVKFLDSGASGRCYIVKYISKEGLLATEEPANLVPDSPTGSSLGISAVERVLRTRGKTPQLQESTADEMEGQDAVQPYLYVMKSINTHNMDKEELTRCVNEVEVLSKLHHPNIIEYRGHFFDDDQLHIIVDYADGGDLQTIINNSQTPFSEEKILDVIMQLLLAIKYVHEKNIFHRDVKPANVLITQKGIVKLCDFGVAKVLQNTQNFAETITGTPNCLAPEVWEGKPYNSKCDMWSLGCVLVELCCRKPAFSGKSLPAMMMSILEGEPCKIPNQYSEELRELASRLLTRNVKKRPDAKTIVSTPLIRKAIRRFVDEHRKLVKRQAEDEHEDVSKLDGVHIPWRQRMDQPSPMERLARDDFQRETQAKRKEESDSLRRHSLQQRKLRNQAKPRISRSRLREIKQRPSTGSSGSFVSVSQEGPSGVAVELIVKDAAEMDQRHSPCAPSPSSLQQQESSPIDTQPDTQSPSLSDYRHAAAGSDEDDDEYDDPYDDSFTHDNDQYPPWHYEMLDHHDHDDAISSHPIVSQDSGDIHWHTASSDGRDPKRPDIPAEENEMDMNFDDFDTALDVSVPSGDDILRDHTNELKQRCIVDLEMGEDSFQAEYQRLRTLDESDLSQLVGHDERTDTIVQLIKLEDIMRR